MKLYLAAAESAIKELSQNNAERILISVANGHKKIPIVPEHFKSYELIIDSGAFTYFKKGGIEVDKWIKLIKSVRVPSSEVISLDVIGNAEATFINYEIIAKEIPDAIPTFHVGSDLSYLHKYLNITQRIAIGGMVPYKSEISRLRRYLDEIFNGFDRTSIPRFHAFGYFSPDILENYPWYSADASTWQNYARFGEFHRFKNMKFERMKSLSVGEMSPQGLSITELYQYIKNDPSLKLKACIMAAKKYENFLTELWHERGVQWK